ncbi:hypothetical protein OPQ81_001115 [Rhizoctonia solani]|nr:hypothetical protein OPQ81_001115 [Rhizoctonia solani]
MVANNKLSRRHHVPEALSGTLHSVTFHLVPIYIRDSELEYAIFDAAPIPSFKAAYELCVSCLFPASLVFYLAQRKHNSVESNAGVQKFPSILIFNDLSYLWKILYFTWHRRRWLPLICGLVLHTKSSFLVRVATFHGNLYHMPPSY